MKRILYRLFCNIEYSSEAKLRLFAFLMRISRIGKIFAKKKTEESYELFGQIFDSRIGLNYRVDRKGNLYNSLSDRGLSYIEIGPLDSKSIKEAIDNICNNPAKLKIAAYITGDHLKTFTFAYDFFDFFIIDFSSSINFVVLNQILDSRLCETEYKPIVVKIPSSVGESDLAQIVDFCMMNNIEAVQISNEKQIEDILRLSYNRLPIIANLWVEDKSEVSRLLELGVSLISVRAGYLFRN